MKAMQDKQSTKTCRKSGARIANPGTLAIPIGNFRYIAPTAVAMARQKRTQPFEPASAKLSIEMYRSNPPPE